MPHFKAHNLPPLLPTKLPPIDATLEIGSLFDLPSLLLN
jgi:hypothetical protein